MPDPAAASVRALFEDHPSIMWIAEAGSGRILAANAAAVRRYGWSRGEFRALGTERLRPPGEEDITHGGLLQRHMTRSGEVLLVEVVEQPIEFGNRPCLLVVVNDVTAALAAESRQRARADAAEAQARQSARTLRAARRLVAGYSRVVAEAVLPLLERLDQGESAGDVAPLREVLNRVQRLEHVGAVKLEPRNLDLSEMAQAEIHLLRLADPARRVHVDIDPLMEAEGDAVLVRVLMRELLANAWKFGAPARHPWIRIGRMEDGGPVPAFFVSDNGAGFDESVQSRLYLPFERLHSAAEYRGAGLGLALARAVVRRHGGHLWARSQPGHGATFVFELQPRPEDGGPPRVQEVVVSSLPPSE